MTRKPRRTDRLPKAPLAEVVFELRWALQSGPSSQPILQTDPGIVPLLDGFTRAIKKAGFGTYKDMSHPLQTGAYGIVRRYYKSADTPFPLMQIGPGIFASNQSSQYEWNSFKSQILLGVKTLLDVYPKLDFFPFKPNTIELRYIDVFDKTLLGTSAIFHFTEHGTSLKFGLPPMLNDKDIFEGDADGRFSFKRPLRERKDTVFVLDLASGYRGDVKDKEDIVRMETKVVSEKAGIPSLSTRPQFIHQLDRWLEFSHGITSPFFKQFVLPVIMNKFAQEDGA